MSARQTKLVITIAFWVALGVILLIAARPAWAGQTEAECHWDGSTLYATGLPDEWSLTATFAPTGVFDGPPTFERTFGAPFTAWFWTRGGHPVKGMPKPGAGLNDYRVVATC